NVAQPLSQGCREALFLFPQRARGAKRPSSPAGERNGELTGPAFSPFGKGGCRGIWAGIVSADRHAGWAIFLCSSQLTTWKTADVRCIRVLCRNPPYPPLYERGKRLVVPH